MFTLDFIRLFVAFGIFFREYVWLVIIAGDVALPPAYLVAMSRWLQGYAYRIDIPWWLPAEVIAV